MNKHVHFGFGASDRLLLLALSLAAGLTSVIVGQKVLAIENTAITVSHCQRLNLQNIFFLNHARTGGTSIKGDSKLSVRLPRYCDGLLPLATVGSLDSLQHEPISPVASEEAIRMYSDALSAIEDRDSELKRNLLITLVAFNVLALAIESLILHRERKKLESEADG